MYTPYLKQMVEIISFDSQTRVASNKKMLITRQI